MYCRYFDTTWKAITVVFWYKQRFVGDISFHLKFWNFRLKGPTTFEKRRLSESLIERSESKMKKSTSLFGVLRLSPNFSLSLNLDIPKSEVTQCVFRNLQLVSFLINYSVIKHALLLAYVQLANVSFWLSSNIVNKVAYLIKFFIARQIEHCYVSI